MDLKMRTEKKKLGDSPHKEEVLEVLKNARMVKKQLGLLKGIALTRQELDVVDTVLKDLEKEIRLFKL